jgi:hypothetical protein
MALHKQGADEPQARHPTQQYPHIREGLRIRNLPNPLIWLIGHIFEDLR